VHKASLSLVEVPTNLDLWPEVATVVGLFLLRLGVPVAITFLVAYLFHRLDRKWQEEANGRIGLVEQATGRPPCWIEKDCGPLRRADCPACNLTDIPCWLARIRMQGELPKSCLDCDRFTERRPQPHLA
jgi:hypothetical protein